MKLKRAIVLSGGGAKGSYQIGVWKALRKLHIKYDIVTGTSVGALNGALMTQKSYIRGIWFWYNITFKNIFNDEMFYDYKTIEGKKAIMHKYVRAIFLDNGMDVTNLESTINKTLNEQKLRKSNIDFGLMTFNLTGLRPIKLTKKDIPVGKLKDYLMASATCFPAFKKKNIDNENYIDGGYWDNLPINLAIEMGAQEIIAVDLGTIGIKHRVKQNEIKIVYINPRNDLGSFLVFHKDLARRGIRFGYNDTMKIFNKLDGDKFTFKRDNLKQNYLKYGNVYKQILDSIFCEKGNSIIVKLLKLTTYKKEMKEKDLNKLIESLGRVFKIDDSFIYDINKFNKMLIYSFNQLPSVDIKLVEKRIKENDIKNLVDSKYVIKYIYDKILIHNDVKIKKQLSSIALLLPQEFLGALYLYIIKNHK